MTSTHLYGPMKHFIKGSEEQKRGSVANDVPLPTNQAAFVSGTHVKQFYEKVVGKDTFEVLNTNRRGKRERSCDKEKQKQSKSSEVPFNINTLMRAIETGRVKDVEKILDGNRDRVNSVDQFGWTPLMSACCAGNQTIVEMLLRMNPQLNVGDKKGNTCRHLASAKGHTHIVNILDKYTQELKYFKGKNVKQSSSVSEQSSYSPFYCKTCKQTIENTSLIKHMSSTVHNFNAASKRKMPTMYGIPENNKGFQILLKSGWDKETGLGPSGDGHKFPPKTILKQDRTGLGAKQYKSRVTHTLEDARREAKPKETFKRKLKSQKRKDQRLERNLREMLS